MKMSNLDLRLVILIAVLALLPVARAAAADGCPMTAGAACAAGKKTTTAAAAGCPMTAGATCAAGKKATTAAGCPMTAGAKCATATGCPKTADAKCATAAGCPKKEGGACCAAGNKSTTAATADKTSPYPLDTCPVTGQKLGAMGKPFVYDAKGREVRFCCRGCVKSFEKDSAKFLKKMDEAVVKQNKPLYPLATCVVSGDKLGGDMGEPMDYVYQNHLVRLCCPGCVKAFNKNPRQYLKKIDDAKAAKTAQTAAPATEKKG